MIGVLGGTFDPVHNGHLRLAVEAAEYLDLAEVRLVPLSAPNHREAPVAASELRLAMLRAAVHGEPRLHIDDRELQRGGISYTVETLQSLREELGDKPICLILGMDAFRGLTGWHQWQRLLTMAHVVIAGRPGAAMPETPELTALLSTSRVDTPAALRHRPAGSLLLQTIPELDVSSTQIRSLIGSGRSVRYLVPDAVLDLITRHRLYQHRE